jgi:hypothetical protein
MSWNAITPSELLLYCVKRVEGDLPDGSRSVGTGYICGVEKADGAAIPVLITNKHVVKDVQRLRVFMHTAVATAETVPDGGHTFLESPGLLTPIIMHPDCTVDLCAILLGPMVNLWKQANPGRAVFYKILTENLIMKNDELELLDVAEQVLMVGCPNGIWDEHNGFPLFRRGVTASHPALNFQGRPEFALDIGVYSGSSGSPVFLIESGLIRTKKGENNFTAGSRFGMLGTLWGGPRINERGELKIEPVPTGAAIAIETGVRMHLGYAIKATETLRLLQVVTERFGRVAGADPIAVETLVSPTPEAIYKATGLRVP